MDKEVIAAFIAVAGVALSVIFSFFTSKITAKFGYKDLFAKTVSGNRMEWLNKVREETAIFSSIFEKAKAGRTLTDNEIKEFYRAKSEVLTRANPNEHKELKKLLNELNPITLTGNITAINENLSENLKKDWDKVRHEAAGLTLRKVKKEYRKTQEKDMSFLRKNWWKIVLLLLPPIIALIVILPLHIWYPHFDMDENAWIAYVAGALAYYGATFLGTLAFWQNERLNESNNNSQEKLQRAFDKLNEAQSIIAEQNRKEQQRTIKLLTIQSKYKDIENTKKLIVETLKCLDIEAFRLLITLSLDPKNSKEVSIKIKSLFSEITNGQTSLEFRDWFKKCVNLRKVMLE